MKEYKRKLYNFLSSNKFFYIVIAFFLFESIWIAVSAKYPQAFDESFHFGLIRIYSHHWIPFLGSQPTNSGTYGAVARDPSYLYHYLMSFPYRIISSFDHSELGQIIILRFINVALLGAAVVLFRKILIRVGISKALANLSIFLFVLIPIVPQVSAQLNYDNLLLPAVALVILLSFDMLDQIRKKAPSFKTFSYLISLCFLTSIVKYAFLPIFLGIILFFSILIFKKYRSKFFIFFTDLFKNWKAQKVIVRVVLSVLILVSFGMFAQRDLYNVAKYHAIEPDCAAVLSVNECSQYSAWNFSYQSHASLKGYIASGNHVNFLNPFMYAIQWMYWMWYRLFFAINGPESSYTNYPPLPLPSAAAIIILIVGTYAFIRSWRLIFKSNLYLVLLTIVSITYVLALFLQGFSTYHYTNILENMNGRYLLPVIIFLVAILGRAISLEFRNASNRKFVLSILILILFLQGGGFITFIARSDDSWDVPSSSVQKVNDAARKITKPVIVNGNKYYTTPYWFFN